MLINSIPFSGIPTRNYASTFRCILTNVQQSSYPARSNKKKDLVEAIERESESFLHITSRERPKSAPYLRLKSFQGTTIENIWKNYFFKKYLVKKVAYCQKNPKRDPLGSINVFYKPKTSKNSRGYALMNFKTFRKNVE